MPPFFSVVTPNLNGARYLGDALASVDAQGLDSSDVEHLVLDGGSTDASVEIVERHPHARLASRRDEGSHDAINKGIAAASGTVVNVLNSDDVYLPGALTLVRDAFQADPTLDAVCGAAAFVPVAGFGGKFSADGPHLRFHACAEDLPIECLLGVPCLNSWFIRTDACRRMGFDNSYDFSADREFLLRVALTLRVKVIDEAVYAYRIHDASRTMSGDARNMQCIVEEHLRMTAALLARGDLPSPARQAARQLRAIEAARLSLFALRQCQPATMLRGIVNGLTLSPLWPLVAYGGLRQRRRMNSRSRPIEEGALALPQ